MLGIDDPYIAYCLDEAGAWLLGQKEPPAYDGSSGKKALNRNKKVLAELERLGGARVITRNT